MTFIPPSFLGRRDRLPVGNRYRRAVDVHETFVWALAFPLALAVGLLAGYVHVAAPFAIAIGLIIGGLAVSSPFAMLVGFLAVLFGRPGEFFPALAPLGIAKLFALGSLGFLGATKLLGRSIHVPPSGHHIFMGWLVVAVLISSQLGSDPGRSMGDFQEAFVKVVTIYILILTLVTTQSKAVALANTIVTATAGLAAYVTYIKLTGQATVEGSRAAGVGFLGDPNDVAMTLLMMFPYAVERMLHGKGGERFRFGLAAFLLIAGILSTQSRGGLLGTAAGSYFIMRSRIKSNLVIGAGLVAMLGVGIVAGGHSSRSSGAVGHGEVDESAQGRIDAWFAGIRMVTRNPATGVGFSRFAQNYESYVSNAVIWGEHETHNAYIKCAAEVGIFGFLPFIGLVGRSVFVGARIREPAKRDDEDPRAYVLRQAYLPAVVGFLITTLFLSATWHWFLYIMLAFGAANENALREGAPLK